MWESQEKLQAWWWSEVKCVLVPEAFHKGHLGQPIRDDHLGYYLPSFQSTIQLGSSNVYLAEIGEIFVYYRWCFCERSECLNPHEG